MEPVVLLQKIYILAKNNSAKSEGTKRRWSSGVSYWKCEELNGNRYVRIQMAQIYGCSDIINVVHNARDARPGDLAANYVAAKCFRGIMRKWRGMIALCDMIKIAMKGVMMLKKNNDYHYVILNYQNSMYEKGPITPLAVIVVSFVEKQLMVFGQKVNIEGLSNISARVVEGVKDQLNKDIVTAFKKAVKSNNSEFVFFNELSNDYKWNLYISHPDIYKSKNIEVAALSLFVKYIGLAANTQNVRV